MEEIAWGFFKQQKTELKHQTRYVKIYKEKGKTVLFHIPCKEATRFNQGKEVSLKKDLQE